MYIGLVEEFRMQNDILKENVVLFPEFLVYCYLTVQWRRDIQEGGGQSTYFQAMNSQNYSIKVTDHTHYNKVINTLISKQIYFHISMLRNYISIYRKALILFCHYSHQQIIIPYAYSNVSRWICNGLSSGYCYACCPLHAYEEKGQQRS